jgi:hypothetical protein
MTTAVLFILAATAALLIRIGLLKNSFSSYYNLETFPGENDDEVI